MLVNVGSAPTNDALKTGQVRMTKNILFQKVVVQRRGH